MKPLESTQDATTRFKKRFKLVTSFEPWQWQVNLFVALLSGHVPSHIALPTGAGKTLTILVWLLARAENNALTACLVYVVDRRAVVDQSTKVVEQTREAILSRSDTSPTGSAFRLSELARWT